MTDRKKLREAAEKATPGPYFQMGEPWFTEGTGVLAGSPDPHVAPVVLETESWAGEREDWLEGQSNVSGHWPLGDPEADARYFAMCDPQTILSLLDELDRKTVGEVVAWQILAPGYATGPTEVSKSLALSRARTYPPGTEIRPLYAAPSPAIGRETVLGIIRTSQEECRDFPDLWNRHLVLLDRIEQATAHQCGDCKARSPLFHSHIDDSRDAATKAATAWNRREDGPRFSLVRDGDGHWYVIPADKMAEWEAWAASDDDDEPAYSNRLGGSPSLLTFTNPVIDR